MHIIATFTASVVRTPSFVDTYLPEKIRCQRATQTLQKEYRLLKQKLSPERIGATLEVQEEDSDETRYWRVVDPREASKDLIIFLLLELCSDTRKAGLEREDRAWDFGDMSSILAHYGLTYMEPVRR